MGTQLVQVFKTIVLVAFWMHTHIQRASTFATMLVPILARALPHHLLSWKSSCDSGMMLKEKPYEFNYCCLPMHQCQLLRVTESRTDCCQFTGTVIEFAG